MGQSCFSMPHGAGDVCNQVKLRSSSGIGASVGLEGFAPCHPQRPKHIVECKEVTDSLTAEDNECFPSDDNSALPVYSRASSPVSGRIPRDHLSGPSLSDRLVGRGSNPMKPFPLGAPEPQPQRPQNMLHSMDHGKQRADEPAKAQATSAVQVLPQSLERGFTSTAPLPSTDSAPLSSANSRCSRHVPASVGLADRLVEATPMMITQIRIDASLQTSSPVLFQNAASKRFYGDASDGELACGDTELLLASIFSQYGHAKEIAAECLEAVAQGKEWQQTVLMPNNKVFAMWSPWYGGKSPFQNAALESTRSNSRIQAILRTMSPDHISLGSCVPGGNQSVHQDTPSTQGYDIAAVQREFEELPNIGSNAACNASMDEDIWGSLLDFTMCPPGRHSHVEDDVWHNLTASPFYDEESGTMTMLLTQVDVSIQQRAQSSINNITELYLNVLAQSYPRHIIDMLSTTASMSPELISKMGRQHEEVTILFMDIVGFTSMGKVVKAQQVMDFLYRLFSKIDSLCTKHKVHKVETAGDCYIVAAGVLADNEKDGFYDIVEKHVDPVSSAARVMAFAQDVLRVANTVCLPSTGESVSMRIGIHTGPVVSGLIGSILPKFSLFGDSMNTASRMESTCAPSMIQLSQASHDLLQQDPSAADYTWKTTNGIEVKGKGMMQTYLYEGPHGSPVEPAADLPLSTSRADSTLAVLAANMSSLAAASSGSFLANWSSKHMRHRRAPRGVISSPHLLQGGAREQASARGPFARIEHPAVRLDNKMPAPMHNPACSAASLPIARLNSQNICLSNRLMASTHTCGGTQLVLKRTLTRAGGELGAI